MQQLLAMAQALQAQQQGGGGGGGVAGGVGVAAMAAPVVTGSPVPRARQDSVNKIVVLPDGTKMCVTLTSLVVVGPHGANFEMSPIPYWGGSAEVQSVLSAQPGANKDADGPVEYVSRSGKMTKLSAEKMWLTGSELWQSRYLTLSESQLSYR